MSPDLTRALHDAVDTGPDDPPFDVTALTGRIRRRRTVRAGVRSGVAVGAAGAVALGAVYVQGRPSTSVLPAARPGAAPGTCGSAIGLLPPPTTEGVVGLAPVIAGETDVVVQGFPQPGTDFGRRVGRMLTAMLSVKLTAEEFQAAQAEAVRPAQDRLDAAEHALALAQAPGGPAIPTVARLKENVTNARQNLEAAQSWPLMFGGPVDAADVDSELLLVHDGTVVATDADLTPEEAVQSVPWTSYEPSVATTSLASELVTCAAPGSPGGVHLPAGRYGIYVSYVESDGDRVAVGPWSLTLLDPPPAPTALPEGFPVDVVPLVGGRLLSADPLGQEPRAGWALEIAVDGDDAATEAADLLLDEVPGTEENPMTGHGYYRLDGWDVRVAPSVSEGGQQTVVYSVLPR